MATTFERTWQISLNTQMDTTDSTHNAHNLMWAMVAYLTGRRGGSANLLGLWSIWGMADGNGNVLNTNYGLGDGIDRWSTFGASTASGAAASVVTGATGANWVRISGLTGMVSGDVGNFLSLSGAASAGNNSKTNTPWKIVNFVSATSVDVYNPSAVTGDANNGAISWAKYSPPVYNNTNLVSANTGSNHSWCILTQTISGKTYYLAFDYNTGLIYQASFWWGKATPTGGSGTTLPTISDQVGWSSQQFHDNNARAYHQGWMTTTGDFILGSTYPLSNYGLMPQAYIWQVVADAKTADLYPVAAYFRWDQSSGALARGNLNTTNYWACRRFDGTTQPNHMALRASAYPTTGQADALFDAGVPTGMQAADQVDDLFDDMVIPIWSNQSGYVCRKGRLVDIRWAPHAMSQYCEPSTSSPVSGVVTDVWLPLNTQLAL